MLTRDYLTINVIVKLIFSKILILQVWDLNMESKPVETYYVHDYLRTKLCALYENDSIFDKFQCCWSGDDKLVFFN